MIFFRLLPLIFAQLLFAAHIMRSYGLFWVIVVLLLLFTLFIRKEWIIRMWQIIYVLITLEWIRTTIMIVKLRLAVEMPYTRLLIIMSAVILFSLFVIYWLQRPRIKTFYNQINSGSE